MARRALKSPHYSTTLSLSDQDTTSSLSLFHPVSRQTPSDIITIIRMFLTLPPCFVGHAYQLDDVVEVSTTPRPCLVASKWLAERPPSDRASITIGHFRNQNWASIASYNLLWSNMSSRGGMSVTSQGGSRPSDKYYGIFSKQLLRQVLSRDLLVCEARERITNSQHMFSAVLGSCLLCNIG